MTEASSSTPAIAPDVKRHAAEESTRHLGPTADRYHLALERYLNAIADHTKQTPAGTAKRHAPVTLVGDVMTRAVVAAHEDAVFKEIVAALARNRVSALPVIDDERKVVGVVSETDLMAHMAVGADGTLRGHRLGKVTAVTRKKAHASTAGELMTSPAVTTRPHASIVEAGRIAARAGVRHLPVVDRNGELIGIVSRGDLLRVFLRSDEEIREEIEHYAANTLTHAQLKVDVTEGVVTLTGKLARATQVGKLVDHVHRVSGVVEVDNQLTARYDDRYLPVPRDAG